MSDVPVTRTLRRARPALVVAASSLLAVGCGSDGPASGVQVVVPDTGGGRGGGRSAAGVDGEMALEASTEADTPPARETADGAVPVSPPDHLPQASLPGSLDVSDELPSTVAVVGDSAIFMNELSLYQAEGPALTRGFRTVLSGPLHPPYDKFCPAPGHGLGFNDLKVMELYEIVNAIEGRPSQQVDFAAPRLREPAANFSGGNQQKVMLAKGLAQDIGVYVFDEPTVGVDVGARQAIYRCLAQLSAAGAAILLVSSDLPELLGMTHRLLVMNDGRITGEFRRDEYDEHRILAKFF